MAQNIIPSRNRTQALGKLYKKITNEDMPAGANTTTEALQKVYEALTEDTKHHINVTEIIDDLAANWSEGGGGSSDFSTATLTVNGNFTPSDLFIAPVVEKDPNNEDLAFPMIQSGNSTYTVILYKGRSALMYMGSQSRTITVSGNIETFDTDVYIITGDCTITISDGAAPTPN